MNEDLIVALVMPYFYLAPWWIVRRDMRSLPRARLAACWNSASFGSAVLALGPFCIPIHFIKAHGWLTGSVKGLLWTSVALLLPDLVLAAINYAIG